MRRYLNFEVDEWRAMPAWKTRMYLEGLNEEFAPRDPQVDDSGEQYIEVPAESVGIVWS